MTYSTVIHPKNSMNTLIGQRIHDIIDRPDIINYMSAIKHVLKNKAHEFVRYTVGGGKAVFLAIILPHTEVEVRTVELVAGCQESQENQKELLLKSVSGLIRMPELV